MIRSLVLLLPLALAACSPPAVAPTGTFAGAGRDRLCVAGAAGSQRAGLIAYGKGDANCSASGRLEPDGAGWRLVPHGEGAGAGDCHIPVNFTGDGATVGPLPANCAYYCAPGAAVGSAPLHRSSGPVTDLAGDPLC